MKQLKKIALFLLCGMIFLSGTIKVYASENSNIIINNDNTDNDVLVIDSEEDLINMMEADIIAYQDKINAIPCQIREDYQTLIERNCKSKNIITQKPCSNEAELISVDYFLEEFPEYKTMDTAQVKKYITVLNNDLVVSVIRAFFTVSDFQLSLALFNHSLVNNPQDAALHLAGHNYGLYEHVKGWFSVHFTPKLKQYAYYETNDIVPRIFDTGDLFWAIHKYDLDLNRSGNGNAEFVIRDIYNFDSDSAADTIDSTIAGWAGCNSFNLTITGSMTGGVLD